MRSVIFVAASLIQDAILYPIKTSSIYSKEQLIILALLFFTCLMMDIKDIIKK